jgi:DNA-binding IclR family transcriptional regulator
VPNEDPVLPARTIQVLEVFLDVPDKQYYAIEIARRVGLAVNSIHPDLVQLVSVGWVMTGLNEKPDPGRYCRRRWYWLTENGRQAADRQPAPERPRQPSNGLDWWWRRRNARR